jgi:hypothetical protein
MTTSKPRINVSFSSDIVEILQRSAKRDQMPIATKVAQLVHSALELEEDEYFAKLASSRLTQDNRPSISHASAWKGYL